jgi:Flp pilus assembly protein TadB
MGWKTRARWTDEDIYRRIQAVFLFVIVVSAIVGILFPIAWIICLTGAAGLTNYLFRYMARRKKQNKDPTWW